MKRFMRRSCFWSCLVLLFVFLPWCSYGTDEEASRVYAEGRDLFMKGEYYDAARKFQECEVLADDPVIKANTLLARIGSYRSCGLHYKEFQVIEELLDRFPEHVGANCTDYIAREFAIGNWFRAGNREPAFWALRWVPWLKDVDREEEVYLAALKRAPFSPEAARARFLLAAYYDGEGLQTKSMEQLRLLLEHHPGAAECKYGLLALADALFQRAKAGDGDGSYMMDSLLRFEEFCRKYPDAAEVEFARNRMAQIRDVEAERMYKIASFYHRDGRSEAAVRYLAQIMNRYPDSSSAPEAEKMLSESDKTYLPGAFPGRPEARMPELRAYPMPHSSEMELVSPLNKEVHYLLPIPDIKGELLENKE